MNFILVILTILAGYRTLNDVSDQILLRHLLLLCNMHELLHENVLALPCPKFVLLFCGLKMLLFLWRIIHRS